MADDEAAVGAEDIEDGIEDETEDGTEEDDEGATDDDGADEEENGEADWVEDEAIGIDKIDEMETVEDVVGSDGLQRDATATPAPRRLIMIL